jgi:hypothetical protein
MNEPPEKEEAAPCGTAGSGERLESNPQIELCKAWLRASPQARRELLQDVKFAHPQLWREVAEGTDP